MAKLLRLGPCYLLSAPSIITPLAEWYNHGKTRGNVLDRYKGNYVQTGTADQSGRTPRADSVYVTGSPQDGYELALLNYQIDDLLYAFPSAVKVTNSSNEAIGLSTPTSTITPRAFALVPVADYNESLLGSWYISENTRFLESGVLHITGELKGQLPDGEDILEGTAYTCMVKALDDESSFTGGIGLYRTLNYTTKAVGNTPQGIDISIDETIAIVANIGSDNVTIIDLSDLTTTNVAVGSNPTDVAINHAVTKAYVTNSSSDNVTVIDLSDNTTSTIAVGDSPQGIDITPDDTKAVVANRVDDNVTIITLSTEATTTVSVGTDPYGVACTPDSLKAIVANESSDNVTIITFAGGTTNVTVGDRPFGISITPDGSYAGVANFTSDTITIIDLSDNSTSSVIVGDSPFGVTSNQSSTKFIVSNVVDDSLSVVDISSESVDETIESGDAPRGVGYAYLKSLIICANEGDNNVSLISKIL